jgi:hypothetical protein
MNFRAFTLRREATSTTTTGVRLRMARVATFCILPNVVSSPNQTQTMAKFSLMTTPKRGHGLRETVAAKLLHGGGATAALRSSSFGCFLRAGWRHTRVAISVLSKSMAQPIHQLGRCAMRMRSAGYVRRKSSKSSDLDDRCLEIWLSAMGLKLPHIIQPDLPTLSPFTPSQSPAPHPDDIPSTPPAAPSHHPRLSRRSQ